LAAWTLTSFAQSNYLNLTQGTAAVAATTAHPLATEAALKMMKKVAVRQMPPLQPN
jgi:hypothetical protein